MSNLNFSKGKFSRFLSSKGFYVAVAVCLIGAGAATWLAVDRTITGIEDQNTHMIESENQWNEYPEVEVEAKQPGITQPAASPEPSASPSQSSTSSSSSGPSSEPESSSDASETLESLPSLDYALPISNNIIAHFSGGELVKNVTLGDWRTHDGVDILADKGTDVLAAADGVVRSIENDALWGTVVTLDHADGNQTVYCGLSSVVPVSEGETVIAKQVIGSVDGIPCESSMETHLHFAMKSSEGKWIDPLGTMEKMVG